MNTETRLSFVCKSCGKRYSGTAEQINGLPPSVRCGSCKEEIELPRLADAATDANASSLHADGEAEIEFSALDRLSFRLQMFWEWITADTKRSWIAFLLCLFLVHLVIKEYRAAASARRTQELLQVQATIRNAPQATIGTDRKKTPSAGPPKGLQKELRDDSADKNATVQQPPADVDKSRETPGAFPASGQDSPKASETVWLEVIKGNHKLDFQNGKQILVEPKLSRNWDYPWRSAAASQSNILVVHRGGDEGSLAVYDVRGERLVKTIHAGLIGNYKLAIAKNGRFLAANAVKNFGVQIFDLEVGTRLAERSDLTAICFSSGKLFLRRHRSTELLVLDPSREVEEQLDRAQTRGMDIGTVMDAEFIDEDHILLGTHEGLLAIVDWPKRRVVSQLSFGVPVRSIERNSNESTFVIDHGPVAGRLSSLNAGANALRWIKLKASGLETDTPNWALAETGIKSGSAGVFHAETDQVAFLERLPDNPGDKTHRKWICIYRLSEPNALVRCLELPLGVTQLSHFSSCGQFLLAASNCDSYYIIDINNRKSVLVPASDDVVLYHSTSERGRPDSRIVPIDDDHFATLSRWGRVSLFKTDGCVEAMMRVAPQREAKIRKILRSHEWEIPAAMGMTQRGAVVAYDEGVATLRGVATKTKHALPITRLKKNQRAQLAWEVGGPSPELQWSYIPGTVGTRVNGRHVTIARLTTRTQNAVVFEQNGAQIQTSLMRLPTATQHQVNALTDQRFQSCLPSAQSLVEREVKSAKSLEGHWVITKGRMFDYEIPSAYPAAKDRTVKIEGNVITFPVFSKPAGNVHFESYRYVFFPRERLMHRFKDQFNADTHMNILRFNRNGLDSATVSFLSGADGITLRRFKENRGDDQLATAKKEVPGNR